MVDYRALFAEISKPAYAGLTDAQIAAAMQAPMTVHIDVPIKMVEVYFRTRLLTGGLKRFVAAPPAGAEQLAAGLGEFLDLLASQHVESVAMSDPNTYSVVDTVLGASASAGLITARHHADLMAMAQQAATVGAAFGLDDRHEAEQEIIACRKPENRA